MRMTILDKKKQALELAMAARKDGEDLIALSEAIEEHLYPRKRINKKQEASNG